MVMLSYEGIHRVEYGVQLVYGAPPIAYTRPDHSYALRRSLEVTLWLLVVWCVKTSETAESVKLAPQAPPCCHTSRRSKPAHRTSLVSSWDALHPPVTPSLPVAWQVKAMRPRKAIRAIRRLVYVLHLIPGTDGFTISGFICKTY